MDSPVSARAMTPCQECISYRYSFRIEFNTNIVKCRSHEHRHF